MVSRSLVFLLSVLPTLINGLPVITEYNYYDESPSECYPGFCLGNEECYLDEANNAVCLCEAGVYGRRCHLAACTLATCLGARSWCENTVDRGPVCHCEEGRAGGACEIVANHTKTDPSQIIAPTSIPSPPSSLPIPITIVGCLLLVSIIVIVVTQIRRAPKKRQRTVESKMTVTIPKYDAFLNQSIISASPMVKRHRIEPVYTDNYLHRLASGGGSIRIENQSHSWMVNARNADGRTPLHCLAAAPSDKKTAAQVERDASMLIGYGADINARDNAGNTPLHLALSHVRLSLVKTLLGQKNIDCCVMNNEEKTPLHIAAQLDDFITLDFIMTVGNAKNSLNMTTSLNYTPLVVNIMSNPCDTTFARKLLTYGADPNYVGDKTFVSDAHHERTAIHYASQYGMLDHIQLLIDNGANVNATDQWKRTALHFAVESRSLKTVKLLVSLGANIHFDNDQGESSLEMAQRLNFTEAVEFFNSDEAKNTEIGGRKRRIRKKITSSIDKAKKKKRESTDTGYQSSVHLEDVEEEDEENDGIDETPMRNVTERRIRSRIFDDDQDPLSPDMDDYQYVTQSTVRNATVYPPTVSYHPQPPPAPQLSLPPTPQCTPSFGLIQNHLNYQGIHTMNSLNNQPIDLSELGEFFEMV